MGQVLSFTELGDFRVTGVMNKPAGKSHVEHGRLLVYEFCAPAGKNRKLSANLHQWNNVSSAYTYLLLKPQVKEKQLSQAVASISKELVKQSTLVGKEELRFFSTAT